MRYPTCYVVVCDGDSAVNFAAFNQQPLKEYTASTTDAPLSRPVQRPFLGSNAAGGAAKPVNPNSFFTSQRPTSTSTRFSKTITTYYYPTILYQAYWIFRGYHSKEVGSI
jgi:hypothetical protein